MLHKTILRNYFNVNEENQGWFSLEALDGKQFQDYRTKRIAKVKDEKIYFTIGETKKVNAL